MNSADSRKIAVVVAILLALTGVGGAVLLFTQTQPAVPSSQMTADCTTTASTPSVVTLGSDGEVTFSCDSVSPMASPAFNTSATIQAMPTLSNFVLPYNDLYIYDADGAINTGPCGARTLANLISAGGSETIPAGGWNYCARYTDVTTDGLPQFTVTWDI